MGDRGFESFSLHRRACKPAVPLETLAPRWNRRVLLERSYKASRRAGLFTGDRGFESISLQQRVSLSAASAFEGREPRLSARVCAAGLATRSAESRRACQQRANPG